MDDDKRIRLDHFDHAASIKLSASMKFVKLEDKRPLTEELNARFIALLGALARPIQTRADIIIHASSLQRTAKGPAVLKRINRLCRCAKKHQHGLQCRKISVPVSLTGVGNSAHQAPTNAAAAMQERIHTTCAEAPFALCRFVRRVLGRPLSGDDQFVAGTEDMKAA